MEITILMSQVLLLVSLAIAGLVLHRFTGLDISLTCIIVGVLAGIAIPFWKLDTGLRADNIHDLVFYVILPVLIYESSWHIRPGILKRWIPPVLLLSTLGLLVSCGVIAVFLYFAIGHAEGFPWLAAFLAGAILSATDPVSVVSSLKRQKAPEDLSTLVEGESLFNDATALVLFSAVLSFSLGEQVHADTSYLINFGTVFFGGLIIGSIIGLISAVLVLFLRASENVNIILIFSAFASFFVAEHTLHVSGILAVVAAALVTRFLLREHEQDSLKTVLPTWSWLGTLFTSVIFVIMGLAITPSIFTEQWLAILIAIPVVLIARAVTVYLCGYLSQFTRWPIPLGWQHILVWGGLKGAIAIVLVLSLPVNLPYWWTIQSIVFGIVLFSLFVQGTTMLPFIRKFGK